MKKTLILTLALLMLLLCGCTSYADMDKYSSGGSEIDTLITSIDVAWSSGEVDISYYDGATVKFYEESSKKLSEDNQMQYFLDGTTLRIRYSKPKIFFFGSANKSLHILIPSSVTLDVAEISVASAKVNVNGIQAEKLLVESASGDVTLDNVWAKSKVELESASGDINATLLGQIAELEADTASGNLNISAQNISEVSADSASGDVKFDFAACPSKLDIDTASGDVKVILPADAQFTLEFDTASGELENGFACTKKGDKYICGSGTVKISIDTASGDLKLKKK